MLVPASYCEPLIKHECHPYIFTLIISVQKYDMSQLIVIAELLNVAGKCRGDACAQLFTFKHISLLYTFVLYFLTSFLLPVQFIVFFPGVQ